MTPARNPTRPSFSASAQGLDVDGWRAELAKLVAAVRKRRSSMLRVLPRTLIVLNHWVRSTGYQGRSNIAGASGVGVILPRADAMVSIVRSEAKAVPGDVVLSVFAELVAHHDDQWGAELVSRRSWADDHAVAASKRRIDVLNQVRAGKVETVDEWVERRLTMRPEAPLHTETLGSIVDRLAIAWVRLSRLAADGDLGSRALMQWTQLMEAYDVLVQEVTAGQRRLPTWRTLKSYRANAA